MPDLTVAPSLAVLLSALGPCFTAPSFDSFVVLMTGWLSCVGRHTVTGVVQAAGAVHTKHHTSFHRFFRDARWCPNDVGIALVRRVLSRHCAQEPLIVAVDDTLARHTGKKIRSAAMHRDPLLSTRAKPFFHFGHVWVVLSVVLRVPQWHKSFALPVLVRLYRTQKYCDAHSLEFRKKPQMASEMLSVLSQVVKNRKVWAVADSDYANTEVIKNLPSPVGFIGRARMDAALYAEPRNRKGQMGRPRVKGERLPSPAARARACKGWTSLQLEVYGKSVTVQLKTFEALWYKVAGGRKLGFVIVRGWPGHDHDDVLFSTERSLTAAQIIELYCLRWNLEVTFQEVKGRLGFDEPQNRTERAVERTAPMALWAYTLTVLWYVTRCSQAPDLPQLPWYPKNVPTFSDMLAALRREIWRHRVLDPPKTARQDQNPTHQLIELLAYAA